ALGCTFNQVTTASYTDRIIPNKVKIIQVDIDPTEFGKNFPMELGIMGDVRAVLQDMIEKLKPEGPKRQNNERLQNLLQAKAQWEQQLLSEGA
ncbi:MAG: hypothetical protein GTO40_29295, partial [Deltaproteobacteria bacterium]|nr:hypothetical protein [Deltaproteobacteria bacterium]